MADYYLSNNNSTYFLSGSLIYFTEGSGSIDKTNSTELTYDWFIVQSDLNISHVIDISNQVSGSQTYMSDKGWL